MDEKGVFEHELIDQFFQLGLMGIEIPEQYGGGGGTFFEAILAVEELSRVDASAGVVVDVQNTLVNNALLRWGTEEQKKRYLPRMASRHGGRLRAQRSRLRLRRLRAAPRKAELKGSDYVLNGRKLWITNGKEAGLFIVLPPSIPRPATRASPRSSSRKTFPGFTVGKKEDKLGIRASSTCELILEDCRVPKENVLGEVGKGYKIAIETLNEGRIGIGAQMLGLARGAWEYARQVRAGAQAVRQADRRVPGHPVPAGADGHRDRGRAPDGLQRRPHEGRRHELREGSRHDQALRLAGGRARGLAGASRSTAATASPRIIRWRNIFRDSKIGKIYEGTSNMQLATIAKLVLGGK